MYAHPSSAWDGRQFIDNEDCMNGATIVVSSKEEKLTKETGIRDKVFSFCSDIFE
jgi:hypothetical protein